MLTNEENQPERLFQRLEASQAVRNRSLRLVSSYLGHEPGDAERIGVLQPAALYISFILEDEPVSQKVVAGAAGISPSTLRRWYKRMASVVRPM